MAEVKLTFIWQYSKFEARDWIADLFRPLAGEQVYDENYRIVLDNSLLIDAFLHGRPREYYRMFRGKNAFLLHLNDETYEGGYDHYDNFRGVFRSYWSGIFNPRRVMQIPLGYSGRFEHRPSELNAVRRPYLWSFLGAAAKSSRPEMLKALLPITPQFVKITDQGTGASFGTQEYQRILRDSIFVPSPMGNVNLDCFRTYEALECGAIPILEKHMGFDSFTNLLGSHPLPTFTNWNQAARFLTTIKNDQTALISLQNECSAWWARYKKSLTESISKFVAAPPGEDAGSFVRWTRSVPGSQAVELMRHHSMPALVRRLNLQLQRLRAGGKLRRTFGT